MAEINFSENFDQYFENIFGDIDNNFLTTINEENNEEVSKIQDESNQATIDDLFLYTNENNTNYVETQESANNEKLNSLNTKVTPLLISLIKTEDFEFGQNSESIRLVCKHLAENKIATQNWFNTLYLKYFIKDENILIGLLRIVEYLDEESLHPTGHTMAIASLVHKNDEIKELAVRIFENWGSYNSLGILKNITGQSKWLQEYIDQVIKDIESELCLY